MIFFRNLFSNFFRREIFQCFMVLAAAICFIFCFFHTDGNNNCSKKEEPKNILSPTSTPPIFHLDCNQISVCTQVLRVFCDSIHAENDSCAEMFQSKMKLFKSLGEQTIMLIGSPYPLHSERSESITKLLFQLAANDELFLFLDYAETDHPTQVLRWIFPYFSSNHSLILSSAKNTFGLISSNMKGLCECIIGKMTLLKWTKRYKVLNSPLRFLDQLLDSRCLQETYYQVAQNISMSSSALVREINNLLMISSRVSRWNRYALFENLTTPLMSPSLEDSWIEFFEWFGNALLKKMSIFPKNMNYSMIQQIFHNSSFCKYHMFSDGLNKIFMANEFTSWFDLFRTEWIYKFRQRLAVQNLENFVLFLNSSINPKPLVLLTNLVHVNDIFHLILTSKLNF